MNLNKIFKLCERRGFLIKVINGATSNNNNNIGYFKIGPSGCLLQYNLKTEWFYSMVINRDNPVFLNQHSFLNTFQYAKEICVEKVPFGIAEVLRTNNEVETLAKNESSNILDFDEYFSEDEKRFLRCTTFVSPSDSTRFFHQWQRQRRMWWRKFSASPGRYLLTDMQNIGNDCQMVEIKAEYPWGVHLIESLKLSTAKHPQIPLKELKVQEGKKKVKLHYVTSNISLSSSVLNALCDAYDEPLYNDVLQPLLRLHRKLAPYKVSFSISASHSALMEELRELALYLCRKCRANKVSCLLLPTITKSTLESEFCHYDQLGIPYTIVLNEDTLKNGLILLRSRETRLNEQVHISNLPTYIEQLFKNY